MTEFQTIERVSVISSAGNAARRRYVAYWICFGALVLLFTTPLVDLVRFAWHSDLYSHTPLIPMIGGYLIWTGRKKTPGISAPATGIAALAIGAAATLLVTYFAAGPFSRETSLSLLLTSLLLLQTAAVGAMLGGKFLKFAAFPLGFLLFMVPIPNGWMAGIESFLQHGSAAVSWVTFKLWGTAEFYHNLVFDLPGMSIRVAPECSGIHSTLALLIVSVLAGHWFLRSPGRQVLLTAAVLPLALLRNGVRIFTVGQLCVDYGPNMIDSPIHRQGGPLFFAASLVPFLALLWLLWRGERRATKPTRT